MVPPFFMQKTYLHNLTHSRRRNRTALVIVLRVFPKIFFSRELFRFEGPNVSRNMLNGLKKRSALSILVSKGIGVGILINPLMTLAVTVKTRHLMTVKHTLTGHLR